MSEQTNAIQFICGFCDWSGMDPESDVPVWAVAIGSDGAFCPKCKQVVYLDTPANREYVQTMKLANQHGDGI